MEIEGKMILEQSEKKITKHVNKLLVQEVDDLQQYTRRSYMVVVFTTLSDKIDDILIHHSSANINVFGDFNVHHTLGP